MKTVKSSYVKAKFNSLLVDIARTGEAVTIIYRGGSVAVLTPVHSGAMYYRNRLAARDSRATALRKFRRRLNRVVCQRLRADCTDTDRPKQERQGRRRAVRPARRGGGVSQR